MHELKEMFPSRNANISIGLQPIFLNSLNLKQNFQHKNVFTVNIPIDQTKQKPFLIALHQPEREKF